MQRRAVIHWLGRCTNERVINVLDNLLLEWEEEKADAMLPAGSSEGLIATFFRELVESSKAVVDYLSREPGLMPAHLGPATAPAEGLHLKSAAETAIVKVTVNLGRDVQRAAVLATTDNGKLHNLSNNAESRAQEHFYILEEDDGRVTFWLIVSTLTEVLKNVPTELAELPPWLDNLSQLESVRIYASRITSAEVLEG